MMRETDSNFDTDILSSFENSGDEGIGIATSPAHSIDQKKMSGVLNIYRGIEELGSDKYALRDEEENPHEQTKKNGRIHLFSRKKKQQGHDEPTGNKGTVFHSSIAKREKFKRLNKLKKKRAAKKPLRVTSSAAAAPVRLADILGGVGDVEYSTGNTGSWRVKMERRNISRPGLTVTGIQSECGNDDEISISSKLSEGRKETLPSDGMLKIRADTSDDCDRHMGYMVHKCGRGGSEDDAIRDESETTRMYDKEANSPPKDCSHYDSTTQEEKRMNSTKVKKLDKYIIPSPSTLDRSNLADTTLRVLLKSSIVAARAQKWDDVLRLVSTHPQILLTRSKEEDNQTLLHVVAGGAPVPKLVVTKMVNTHPEAVSYTDNDGCLPLHHACSVMNQIAMVKVLLDSWPEGATIANIDGDLPLHVATWGGDGYEDICNILLSAHAGGVNTPNSSGGLPMHMACCKENASPATVRRLIQVHKNMDIHITRLDRNGNSPLHVAIKTKAPHEVISEIFHGWDTTEAFSQQDRDGMYPLHMALIVHKASPEVIGIISKAAPSTMSIPLKNGLMPARLAIERYMPGYIVQDLVLADMPVKLGNINNDSVSEVIFRRHNHSWWFLGIRQDKYKDVIDDIFAKRASVPEIIALAQVTDPNGTSSLCDGAHQTVRSIIKKHLRFCDRYELVTLKKAKIVDGVLILRAIDHGHDITQDELAIKDGISPLPCKNGYTTVNSNAEDEDCFEVILYDSPEREVMLHCCPEDSTFHDELVRETRIRKGADISSSECQRLYNAHTVDGGRIGCNGDIICLALERPVMTLNDIFESSRFRKRKSKEWARKSCNLLKRIAHVLYHLHERGFVHGHVGPLTIAKFDGENNWKLTDIGKISPIGSSMRGMLRTGAPPESVSQCALYRSSDENIKKLVSFDNSTAEARERISEKSEKMTGNNGKREEVSVMSHLKFTPEKCAATISWDIWSLGLVMGQLVLGQSMVYLPNFENATDAHLKNLYNYGNTNLQKIEQAAKKTAGEIASNLLIKLLQPSPEKRPLSIAEVLNDKYFIDESDVC